MLDIIPEIYKKKNWPEHINALNADDIYINVFHYQYKYNEIYKKYVDAIHIKPENVKNIKDIPFLPILFFKTHKVTTHNFEAKITFGSSGTTGMERSFHYLRDDTIYKESFTYHFEKSFGSIDNYIFLCLLPSYLERQDSSLVYMAQNFIEKSGNPSQFYLHDWEALKATLIKYKNSKKQIILLGVTFALLDFAEANPMDLEHVWIMETGGMKGRREHWNRQKVHNFLQDKLHPGKILSEYGMTELLGQAYTQGEDIFYGNSLFKPMVRDLYDPLNSEERGKGALNIIDLANIHSCCFIATEDLVEVAEGNEFKILGRMDHSALRGCSLMTV